MTHLILDVLNPEGLHPFWPVKWKLRIPGISQLMAGGGIIVLGTTLIPLLSTLF